MRIGELSQRTGVSVRALRYYEDQGLLVPERRPNGYRDYSEAAVERVAQITTLFAAGLCSTTMVDLLPCIHSDGPQVVAGSGLTDELESETARMRGQIEAMQDSLRILEGILATSRTARDETR